MAGKEQLEDETEIPSSSKGLAAFSRLNATIGAFTVLVYVREATTYLLVAFLVHFLALFGMLESARVFCNAKALPLLLYTAKDTQWERFLLGQERTTGGQLSKIYGSLET